MMTLVEPGLSQPDNLDLMRSTMVNLLLAALLPHALCFPNLLLPKATSSEWGKAGPGGNALIPPGKGGTFGYITVREGAHMFWWFEPCRECHHEAVDEEPLIIWLQGGPGASGTGYGAFEEIGPYTIGFRERKHNWASRANLLFIDNPVGTGFSYVEPHANFSQSNNEIASDLMVFINEWLFGHPEFKKAPMHIFSESYGGKMAIQWARDIDAANKAGKLEVNFRGIALGDSWISPISYVQAWPGYLHALSLLDDAAEEHLATFAADTKQAMEDGNFTGATMLWSATEFEAENLTDSVSFYNVLVHEPGTVPGNSAALQDWLATLDPHEPLPLAAQKLLHRYHPEKLGHFMNHEVRELVGIIPDDVIWGAQSGAVFSNLTEDFMLDVVGVVDDVLDRGVPVYIYSGQLDLICCHIGTEDWIQTLDWEGRADFEKAPSQPLLHQDGELMGFRKQHTNLHQFVLLNAGHMVPRDQPRAGLLLVDSVLQQNLHSRDIRSTRHNS